MAEYNEVTQFVRRLVLERDVALTQRDQARAERDRVRKTLRKSNLVWYRGDLLDKRYVVDKLTERAEAAEEERDEALERAEATKERYAAMDELWAAERDDHIMTLQAVHHLICNGETKRAKQWICDGLSDYLVAERKREASALTIEQLVRDSYERACRKGWHDEKRSVPESLCLLHSEVSEALEAFRDGQMETTMSRNGKPEGLPSELADVAIRLGDLCGELGVDLEQEIRTKAEYNERRPHRHGGKAI